jgi:serine/threonine-protein kinase
MQTSGTPSQEFETGKVVGGRYRLAEQIGVGGMATIWKAEHLVLGSPVAVKFLHPGVGRRNSQLVERFMREARVAAAVRHRNVIEIKDFGVADDQRTPYMVMELLEGESLADRMEREPQLNVAFATHIMWLTLRGLAAVHDAGIVHRDLKPENIFLVDDPDGTYPKLLDFGVSRRAADADITQEGLIIGTPSYMSPEQAKGLRDIDVRTDIFSLGVMLWEMLAGRLPLDSDSPQELLRMIVQDAPPPLAQLRPDVPQALVEVIERAMAKNPDDRYHDAREMRWALAQAGGLDMASERGSGVSRISEFPDVGTGKVPLKIPRDQPTGVDAHTPFGMARTEEIEALPPRQNATGEIQSIQPARRWPRVFWVSFFITAIGGGVLLALFLPQVSEVLGVRGDDPAWEPSTRGITDDFEVLVGGDAAPEPDAEAELFGTVRLFLAQVPGDAVASVDGIEVPGGVAWVPRKSAAYHVEVRRGGTAVWEIEHPGDVDGEYEVTVAGEVDPTTETAPAIEDTAVTPEPDTDAIAEPAPSPSMRASATRRRAAAMRRRAMR